jgi:hypothetical protein
MSDSNSNSSPASNSITLNDFMAATVTWGGAMASAMTEVANRYTAAATVQNWYRGSAYHVEQIKSGDGKLLQDTQVDKLVQAMAAFAPPAMGQTSLTAAQQTALAPVLAANWH